MAASFLPLCLSIEIRLFPSQPATANPRYKKFTFSDTQVCYSLDSCYDNIAVSAAWIDAPKGTRFVFYEGSECTGDFLLIASFLTTGSVDFSKVAFANKLSSFLLWKSSRYPVGGMMDICLDEEEFMLIEAGSYNASLED
ncbi:hypothetical protein PRIC1_009951 [Phytophthora ramorum]